MKVKYVGTLNVKVQEGHKVRYGDVIDVSEKTAASLIFTGNFEKVIEQKLESSVVASKNVYKKIRKK